MPDSERAQRVDAVRRFNRFYTQRIGVLEDHYQDSLFSLAEARVLYELVHRDRVVASEIAKDLGLDNGYLSRILRRFENDGLIRRQPSKEDARQSLLSPTARGRQRFAALEATTREGIEEMLRALPEDAQRRIVHAMTTIAGDLSGDRPALPATPAYVLRPPAPGDFGWIVERHAVLYAREYGWTEPFEGLCAQIVADFANKNDPTLERCWIAERGGERAGSIFLVADSKQVARVRLLLVEPSARGLGIGDHLTRECVTFAREAGYRRITLWTHSILTSARNIYRRAGFRLVNSKPHQSWGKDVVGETWELEI